MSISDLQYNTDHESGKGFPHKDKDKNNERTKTMNEMVNEWLKALYTGAIEGAKSSIANERLWQNGADADEDIIMHEQNIANLEEYIEVLEAKLAEL